MTLSEFSVRLSQDRELWEDVRSYVEPFDDLKRISLRDATLGLLYIVDLTEDRVRMLGDQWGIPRDRYPDEWTHVWALIDHGILLYAENEGHVYVPPEISGADYGSLFLYSFPRVLPRSYRVYRKKLLHR